MSIALQVIALVLIVAGAMGAVRHRDPAFRAPRHRSPDRPVARIDPRTASEGVPQMTATIKFYLCAVFVVIGLIAAVHVNLRSALDVGSHTNLGEVLRQAEQAAGVGK